VVGFGGPDMILEEGHAVGELTSRVRLPGWETTLALGRLNTAHFRGGDLHIVVSGKAWPLVPRNSAWQAALQGFSA
jgi:hypothetical protein